MEINVSQLMQEPIGSTREYQLDEEARVLGDEKEDTVRGDCRLLRTRRGILANCSLDSEAELTCSRCLQRYKYPLQIKFEEEFLPTIDVTSGLALPDVPPDDANAFRIDENHILDLTDAVRQYALMTVPMKPLCKQDCAGLCPACGTNLNTESCHCPDDDIDPRWSQLTKLHKQK